MLCAMPTRSPLLCATAGVPSVPRVTVRTWLPPETAAAAVTVTLSPRGGPVPVCPVPRMSSSNGVSVVVKFGDVVMVMDVPVVGVM